VGNDKFHYQDALKFKIYIRFNTTP